MLLNLYSELSDDKKLYLVDVAANQIYQQILSGYEEELKTQILNSKKSREVSNEDYILELERLKERRELIKEFQEINTRVLNLIKQ